MFETHYLTTFILDLTTFNLNVKLILKKVYKYEQKLMLC